MTIVPTCRYDAFFHLMYLHHKLKKQQAMKALKTNISVMELQKIIKLWRSRKITDSTISKLLDLYLGLTAYMNEEKVYPIENFYDIKMSLRFSTTQSLIEAIKRSQTFEFIQDDKAKQIKAFYSPLWHHTNSKNETNEIMNTTSTSPNLSQAFAQTLVVDNIYNNIYTKGSSSDEELSPISEPPSKNFPSKKDIVTPESLAAAKDFFHLINKDSTQKAQILTPLINWFQLHEGLTRKHACENLIYLVNELLIPYFASQARFMKSNHTGRLCWLNNLLKSAHGQHLLNDAARTNREKRKQAVHEIKSNQRSNHPLSEFEWTDPESEMRFYDDEMEGTVNIPEDAPSRPSAEATWNVLSNKWV